MNELTHPGGLLHAVCVLSLLFYAVFIGKRKLKKLAKRRSKRRPPE